MKARKRNKLDPEPNFLMKLKKNNIALDEYIKWNKKYYKSRIDKHGLNREKLTRKIHKF
jgi:hypothetical protein